jgi:lactoylglutathione lyase
MKSSICLTTVLIFVAFAAVGDDQEKSKPPGMSLRLELFVSDLEKSGDFYTKVLGFERLKEDADYLPVRSGSVLIGLSPAATLKNKHYFNPELQKDRRGLGTEIVLEVDDVRAFFEKVKASGYKKISSPLSKKSWGATDFRIVDPDGYYLRITSR